MLNFFLNKTQKTTEEKIIKELNLFELQCEELYGHEISKTLVLRTNIQGYKYKPLLEKELLAIVQDKETLQQVQETIEKEDKNLQNKFKKHLTKANKDLKSTIAELNGIPFPLLHDLFQSFKSFKSNKTTHDYQKLDKHKKD